ncbi:hypothetical protein P7B02_13645 [Caulobacter segnis]|uniref:hypothetical protein n=1 Tax=Caulobacter segnis TaxID=88688 RepID=UPI00240F81E4|nr:hypothetical protein [Caulobacter segnis]MDG2522588.1 hypothetical protein [Caulobacter segnis]
MTPEAFRALVMSLPRVRERAVLGAWEYRVRDRAFATRGWPQSEWLTLKVPAGDLAGLLARERGWQSLPGRPGVVLRPLGDLDEEGLRPLLRAAWKLANEG